MMRLIGLVCLSAVLAVSLANVADNRTPKDHVSASNNHISSVFNDRLSAADVCSECKEVVQKVDEMLHSAEKLEEFKMALKMICDYLGGDEKEECKTIIDNIDVIIHKVEPYLNDPQLLCKEIGFCGENNDDLPRLMRMSLVHAKAFLTRDRNDVLCDECQFVMNEVKNIVAEKGTQEEAKELIESACNSVLSGSSATECVNIVDQYLPLLWDEVVALLDDTHGLCVDLSLCSSITARKTKPMSLIRLLPALRTSLRNGLPNRQTPRLDAAARFIQNIQTPKGINVGCILCEIGYTGLIDWLRDGDIMDLLEFILPNLVCSKLPSDYNDGCTDFLGIYLRSVLVMTLDEVKESFKLCNFLKLCDASDRQSIAALSVTERSAALCEGCTLMAEFLQHELADVTVQDDVTHVVEKVCEHFGEESKKECNALLETYLPAVFQAVALEMNPKIVCPKLHLCDAAPIAFRKVKKTKKDF